MDTRKIMLIVGALVIAIGAAFGVNQMMRGATAPEARAAAAPEINGPMILVATRQLPAGTIVGPDSFRFQPWPKELVLPPGTYFWRIVGLKGGHIVADSGRAAFLIREP